MTTWLEYIEQQKSLCDKSKVDWKEIDPELIIGIADDVLTDMVPVNGLRHLPSKSTSGWYIWSGQTFSEAEDFFKPVCIKHLPKLKPEIIKYLALPPGYRFLLDDKGYEDIWEDKALIIN